MEQDSGLWIELDGGRLEELGRNEFFRRRALGFQKVRTRDGAGSGRPSRSKVKGWLKDAYPAELEGSDPKKVARKLFFLTHRRTAAPPHSVRGVEMKKTFFITNADATGRFFWLASGKYIF